MRRRTRGRTREIPARPTVTYQLRLRLPTYWIFASRLSLPELRVTGIASPLNGPGWRETDLEVLEYDEDPERVQWANEQMREFALAG